MPGMSLRAILALLTKWSDRYVDVKSVGVLLAGPAVGAASKRPYEFLLAI